MAKEVRRPSAYGLGRRQVLAPLCMLVSMAIVCGLDFPIRIEISRSRVHHRAAIYYTMRKTDARPRPVLQPQQGRPHCRCAAAAVEGVHLAGGDAEAICINDLRIGVCQACWSLTAKAAGALPPAAPLPGAGRLPGAPCPHSAGRRPGADHSCLLGRFERVAQGAHRPPAPLRGAPPGGEWAGGKPVLCVAAAGGSGNGQVTCLLNMERWVQHVQARLFDRSASIAGAGPTSSTPSAPLPRPWPAELCPRSPATRR